MSKPLATTLALAAMAAAPAAARADDAAPPPDRMLSVGARLGAIAPQPFNDLGSFLVAGIEAGFLAPVLERRLQIGIAVLWSRPPASGGGMDPRLSGGSYTWELEQQMFVVELAGMFRARPPGSPLVPFGRLGARLYALDTTLDGASGAGAELGMHREGATEPGVVVGGGVEAALGPGTLVGQLDVGFSDLNLRLTGDTNAGAIEVSAGYRVFF